MLQENTNFFLVSETIFGIEIFSAQKYLFSVQAISTLTRNFIHQQSLPDSDPNLSNVQESLPNRKQKYQYFLCLNPYLVVIICFRFYRNFFFCFQRYLFLVQIISSMNLNSLPDFDQKLSSIVCFFRCYHNLVFESTDFCFRYKNFRSEPKTGLLTTGKP